MTVRVSPPRIFPLATRAAKPPADAAGSPDASRQTTFVLGSEVDLVVRGLNIEGAIAEASAGAKFRKQETAAAMGLWSRAWLSRLEALHAVEWGNYAAAVPLVRAAADYEAADVALLQTGAAEWDEWLEQGGIALAQAEHATEYRLHAFRSGEVLAQHAILGPVYRAASDLAMPHFGATLLLAGSDSTPDRVLMTFGDRDFHFGLAQICLGWLVALGVAQLEAALAAEVAFAKGDASAVPGWLGEARRTLAAADRCRVETVERAGERRYVVQNWRRTPGAAAKRVLL